MDFKKLRAMSHAFRKFPWLLGKDRELKKVPDAFQKMPVFSVSGRHDDDRWRNAPGVLPESIRNAPVFFLPESIRNYFLISNLTEISRKLPKSFWSLLRKGKGLEQLKYGRNQQFYLLYFFRLQKSEKNRFLLHFDVSSPTISIYFFSKIIKTF